ncbi:Lrp/AsnC family transcriptional regulator [Candidatus Woesearchaeota archaeon]|nr:Lrp/AsnC family transcriptional regulator [Candidatus Woesearchaeota archaeon]
MLKKKDLVLTAYLRQNSRASLTILSRKTGVPVSTIFDRLKTNKIIVKNTALLDFSKMGYGARATILLRAKKNEKQNLKDFLMASFNVNSLYKVNNGFDFMFECIFRDIKELEEFVDAIDEKFSIRSKEIHYIIDEIKKETFLSQPELVELVYAQ